MNQGLQAAAAGVLAMAGTELLFGALAGSDPEARGQRGPGLGRVAGQAALGATMGYVYAMLVPESAWGPESGLGFARLPVATGIAAAARLLRTRPGPAQLAVWGALAGGLLAATRSGGRRPRRPRAA